MNKNRNLTIPYFLRLSYLYESDHGLYAEEEFHRLVDLETKRAARSKTVSLLLLLDLTGFEAAREGDRLIRDLASALFASTREVDAKGWHRYRRVLGVLVTDVQATLDSLHSTRDAIVDRLRVNLARTLDSSDVQRIKLLCRMVPSLPDGTSFVEPSVIQQEGRLSLR